MAAPTYKQTDHTSGPRFALVVTATTVSADVDFPSSAGPCRGFIVGAAGIMACVMAGDGATVLIPVPAGEFSLVCTGVRSASSTVGGGVVALW